MQLPTSAERVPTHTAQRVNERIQRETERSIAYHAQHPDEIDHRLRELDEEWDIERVLETNAATLALSGTLLAMLFGRRWLLLPAVVTGFLLQHGTQGWCPPLPVLRRIGIRTPQEIEAERYALKAIRGDFRSVQSGPEGARDAARATRRQFAPSTDSGPAGGRGARAHEPQSAIG